MFDGILENANKEINSLHIVSGHICMAETAHVYWMEEYGIFFYTNRPLQKTVPAIA